MSLTDALGWGSSALLVVTIVAQIHRQWARQTSEGVSPWLFVGQGVASAGLLGFSWLSDQLVFVVLNVVMMVAAGVGLGIWFRLRDR